MGLTLDPPNGHFQSCFKNLYPQGSISPGFLKNAKLLRAQIPKVQKETDDLTVFLRFWYLHTEKLHIKCW